MAVTAHGDSMALARWAYATLRRKQWGVLHVLVVGDDSAQLLSMRKKEGQKAERENPERIAGYYLGCKDRAEPYVGVRDLLGAIEATVGEAA